MTELVERLHTIRAHLQTGALGQREVWEEWLTEAGSEIERLTTVINGMVEKGMDDLTMVAAFQVNEELRAEIARLRAALQEIACNRVESRAKLEAIARRALEPKP